MAAQNAEKKKEKILNVPNTLTMFRMALIPVFILCFTWHPAVIERIWFPGKPYNFHIPALCIFILASLTDTLDGYIARHFNQITSFGKLFDPLADKLMVISIMICTAFYIRNVWFTLALLLILIKEIGMLTGGMYMLQKGVVVYAKWYGKAAQFLIVIAIIASFFHNYFVEIRIPVHYILIWGGVALTYYAGIRYLNSARKQLSESGKTA